LFGVEGIVTNYFEDNQVITILATDTGNYLYQLDFGPLQESNVFQNVSSGLHTINVVDANGCANPLSKEIMVVNYPKFFSPNEDGYNDRWNISGLAGQLDSKISIYDRYGKLMKQITPRGNGWDGTYNGQLLPADDYWFVMEYEENGSAKEFRAHFSLKR
jgi:gliding motility-associated-like protein